MEINNAPKGRPMLLVKKSAKSNSIISSILISDNTPNDKALGMPTRKMHKPKIQAAFLRRSYFDFIPMDTTISNMLIEDVSVANNNRTKNSIKKNSPKIICSNTAGMIMNTNPGPASGEKPNANTAGKITRPAMIEITIFNTETLTAELPKLVSFGKYEA